MLPAEEARSALLSLRNEAWSDETDRRIRKLPRKLRGLASTLASPSPVGYDPPAHEAHRQALWKAATELDEHRSDSVAKVMTALHPGLGPTLARWWVDAQSEPYSRGWTRRAFRAPKHPHLSRENRTNDLRNIVLAAGPYDRPPEWFAVWAPFLDLAEPVSHTAAPIGVVLASAIDNGGQSGDATYRALVDSGNGAHPIGGMGRHVIVGLLRCSRPDAWAFIESMLLAAQRQEGLRQSILEAADEAHPEAFSRIIDLIVRENLIRFAATIRAVSVWFGFPEDAEHIDDATRRLEMLRAFRADPHMAARRVLEGDVWDTYAGLCALAQFDVDWSLQLLDDALALPQPDSRAAAVRFLANTHLPYETVIPTLASMTADKNLAVAAVAHESMGWFNPDHVSGDVYEPLYALAHRLPPKATTTDPVGIDPQRVPLDRGAVVATMVRIVGDRPIAPLLEFLPSMEPQTKVALMMVAAGRGRLDRDLREAVVKMVGDPSSRVRQAAIDMMRSVPPNPAESPAFEALLTRKAGDLRRGVLTILSRQPVDDALGSAQRLFAAGTAPQRDAACELLTAIERTDDVVATARQFRESGVTSTQDEMLGAVLGDEGGAGTTAATNADDPTLGLYDPAELTPPSQPQPAARGRHFIDAVALRIVDALDDIAEAHRDTPFQLTNWQGSTEVLLADAEWLPGPFQVELPAGPEGQLDMVLPDVFRTWWSQRPEDCRGESDALDALRALMAAQLCVDYEVSSYSREAHNRNLEILRTLVGKDRLQVRHSRVVLHVLEWMVADTADATVITECMEAAEATLAAVPRTSIQQLAQPRDEQNPYRDDWRNTFATMNPWMVLTDRLSARDPFLMTPERLAHWYGLMRWFDEPVSGSQRHRVAPRLLHDAHAIGAASDADVLDDFIADDIGSRWRGGGRELLRFTKRRRNDVERLHPTVVPLADQVRGRVIEFERSRGELSTPASPLAFRLASIEGAEVALELLAKLGRSKLVRGYIWNNDGRDSVYSRLLQVSYPSHTDTPDSVAEIVARHRIKEPRLIELAMFAPQWAPTIEAMLGWDGLEDAVWWFHSHTKDDRWSVEAEVRETWAVMSGERTPLDAHDLTDGAVDVAWFARARERLDAQRWTELHKAAKLASGGAGHKRAQSFASAMTGELGEAEVVTRIKDKRHQDSVRTLGLIPLPEDDPRGAALRRYGVMRAFEHGSKKFGQQRQRSEATAVRIGIENLARTTGAADPQRFVWAMEAQEAGDLADGPVSVTEDDVTVTLSVTDEGLPEIAVRRGDKPLKSVPAKLRKNEAIKSLTDRRTALKRQASRVRRSLEDAMVRQDEFTGDDLAGLDRHPVVAPMLGLCIWVDTAGATFRRQDRSWLTPGVGAGVPTGPVRLAHPIDLLGSEEWIDWQEELFDDAQRQPFKQAFRELYVLTEAEAADSPLSRRWSGHQLQPGQASGLFTARGWLSDRDQGQVAKVFHHAGLVARVDFVDGWGTPAEVELPTVDTVYFTKRGEHSARSLDGIPAVVFSETMRDLDLVVSVAHAGGVDPEVSASTVEMRAALVRETARLMVLDNVRQESSHIVVEGSLGEYSVHLGSGTVHRRPGGALCIIPVDAQRRGRIFLPFADDDPKSAEVVSKVLMLARDNTIKDPTILEQLRS